MGPAVYVVRWNERPRTGKPACGFCVGPAQEIAEWPYIGPDENVKATVVKWNQKQPRDCFVEEYIWLCVHGMPASSTTGTIFNRLYSLA
jgi:hypothetical protein